MTYPFNTRILSFITLMFFVFNLQFSQSKYVAQYINIDYSKQNPGINQFEKENIWISYVKLSEGNWIHYSFSDSAGGNQSFVNRSSKILCEELSQFLIDKGLEYKRITMKYSPHASLVVYKESGKNIHANYVTRELKNAQIFSVNNLTGGSCLTKAGNKIDFPAEAFRCAKDAVVDIEIHEMLSKGDFVRSGYTSTSNKKILESRGMYHIKASHEGKQVDLRRGKSAEIKFAKNNFPTINEARLFNTFYGNEKKGIVDWKISAFEKTINNAKSGDLPPISKRRTGKSRLTRKVTYTETTFVQLCKKIHLINVEISKNLEGCKLNKQGYNSLVAAHGKLNRLSNGKLEDINSYRQYLSVARDNPDAVLLGLNKQQKENFDNKATKERNEQIAAAKERQRIYEEEQAMLKAEREARAAAELNSFPVMMKISKLGNINCDRFDNSMKKTNVIVQLDEFDYDKIKVYAVFNDIKSVIHGYYRKEHKGMIRFDNLPEGKNVTYLAAAFKGEQVKLAYLAKDISEDDHVKLTLTSYTRENYERILDDLIP